MQLLWEMQPGRLQNGSRWQQLATPSALQCGATNDWKTCSALCCNLGTLLFSSYHCAPPCRSQHTAHVPPSWELVTADRLPSAAPALLTSLLLCRSQGVTVIGEGDDVEGHPFDPAHMEAVMRQPAPAGAADGDVLRVLRKGYAVGERLVRPALVVVAYED